MLRRFFSTSSVDQLSEAIVAEMRQALKPELCEVNSRAADKGRAAALQQVNRQVQQFAASHRLNVYQKAQLGIRLQEALEAAGYTAAFSKRLCFDVVSSLAKMPAPAR